MQEVSDLSELLPRARHLAAQGRRLEAIDLLQQGNVGLHDPAVEEELVLLRRDAIVEIDRSGDPPQPVFDDPWPDRTDLIELEADEATPELVGGAIQHHGAAFVRGLLEPEVAHSLRRDIDRAFDSLMMANDGRPVDETRPWYVPMPEHPDMPGFEPEARADPRWYRVCVVDSPRAMFNVVDAYERAGIHDLIRALLGTRPLLTGQKWALRRVPHRDIVAWHQETSVFDSGPLRTVNIWMALSEAGEDAPGFDVLPRRETTVHPVKMGFAMANATFDEVRDREPGTPRYQPGDAMIFDEMTIHRTRTKRSMPNERYNIESWYFSPGGLPERDAIVL